MAPKLGHNYHDCGSQDWSHVYVVPTRMEETPKAALDIHCLQQGGGTALTQTIN